MRSAILYPCFSIGKFFPPLSLISRILFVSVFLPLDLSRLYYYCWLLPPFVTGGTLTGCGRGRACSLISWLTISLWSIPWLYILRCNLQNCLCPFSKGRAFTPLPLFHSLAAGNNPQHFQSVPLRRASLQNKALVSRWAMEAGAR